MMQNIEAEQTIVGAILLEGALAKDTRLKVDHFHHAKYKHIFKAMTTIADKDIPVDVVTVTKELVDQNALEVAGGVAHLTELAGSVPTTANFQHYENIILESYRNRKTRELALQYAENPNDESLSYLLKQLEEVQTDGINDEERTTKDYLLEIAEDMASPPEQAEIGFKTGFTDLDNMTGGLQQSDLIIIAARPSVGKSAFALNMAEGHCDNGGTSHIFSLEMGTKQLLQRMISSKARIDGQKWRSMAFSEEDYINATNAIGIISEWNLEIYENTSTINEIRANIRKAVNDNPDENHLVIIDYLQLIVSTGRYERRDLEVGAMTRELKLLARELDIPIVLLSQLSRNVEHRQDKRPMMSDLRESGNIEQDADVIGFLYRDDYYDKESEKQNIIEIILAKQRNGPIGTVELAFLKEYGRFLNLAYTPSNTVKGEL